MRVLHCKVGVNYIILVPKVGSSWIFPHTQGGWSQRAPFSPLSKKIVEWPEECWEMWRTIWGCPADLDSYNPTDIGSLLRWTAGRLHNDNSP